MDRKKTGSSSSTCAPRPPNKRAKDPETLVGHQAVCDRFDVSKKTVQTWVSKGLPCSGPDNKRVFVVAELDRWVEAYRKNPEAGNSAAAELNLSLKEEKLSQEKLKSAQIRHKLDAQEGELLPRRTWELFAATLLTRLGDLADQLPDLIAGEVPAKYRKRLQQRLRMELAQWRTDTAEDLKHGPATNAAE